MSSEDEAAACPSVDDNNENLARLRGQASLGFTLDEADESALRASIEVLPPLSPNTGATLQVRRPSQLERELSIQEALSPHSSSSSPCTAPAAPVTVDVSDDTLATLEADSVSIRRWLVCFCVVNFDLNIGQTLEWVYPRDALDTVDVSNICNLSFPDSNVSQIGDSIYTFTLRLRGQQPNASLPTSQVFGVSFFRQQRDDTNARGYFQKSVVLLSHLPFVELFESVVEIVGPLYFEYGLSLLEAACRNISEWPNPNPSITSVLEVPLLGHVLETNLASAIIPSESSRQFSLVLQADHDNDIEDGSLPLSSITLFGSFTHVNVFREYRRGLGNLWCLWEIVVTGQPLLIVSSCPIQCSRAVLGLISLMNPVPFRGDFRPYFTVSDANYQHYQSMHSHGHIPCAILGVTSPFFLKAFENFTNILCLGLPPSGTNGASSSTTLSPASAAVAAGADCATSGSPTIASSLFRRRRNSRQTNVRKALSRTSNILRHLNDAKLVSKRTPLLVANQSIIDRLIDVHSDSIDPSQIGTISLVNNNTIREHFHSVTDAFISIFLPYFKPIAATLSPERGHFNPYLDLPRLPPFSEDVFLDSLSTTSGKAILAPLRHLLCFSGRNACRKLYARFLRTPHFLPWFNERREAAQREIDASVDTAIASVDISQMLDGLRLSQALEMKREIQRRMRLCDNAKAPLKVLLAQHLAAVAAALPQSASDDTSVSQVEASTATDA